MFAAIGVMTQPVVGGVTAVSLEVKSKTENASDLANYTISSADIGSPSANRWVAVAYASHRNVATTTAFTLGGVTYDYLTEISTPDANGNSSGVGFWKVPTGSTANVSITFSTSRRGCALQVFVFQSSAVDPRSDTKTSSTGSSASVDVPSGGGAMAAAVANDAGGAAWSGLTERAAVDANTNEWCSTAGDNLTEETARAISFFTGNGQCIAAVAIKPN
uniref:hypothetical protein n=1 Tax=Pararhizobium sp. IMCC3301 TaxID=3067904 RepID=UPI002741642B|nr:hypothetical protein [Pararhizobium sp. IMCC3301]